MERTPEQIREHYQVEKEIAKRLREASREERNQLLHRMYDELFERVPHHPRLHREDNPRAQATRLLWQMGLLEDFLSPSAVFMEIGCGDCLLCFNVAAQVKEVYGVDITDALAPEERPCNSSLVITDGVHIDLPGGCVDVAYSNQLMEHLHPEDAADQLREIYRVLAPGGHYVCVTPNRVSGPHDVSKYFDEIATGFHLKEYVTAELKVLFRQVGFDRFRVVVGPRIFHHLWPPEPSMLIEKMILSFPHRFRRRLARNVVIRQFVGYRFVGRKASRL